LEYLFDEALYTPEKLLKLYKDDVEVLYNIYFTLLEEGITFDYTGEFFITFLKNNKNNIQNVTFLKPNLLYIIINSYFL